MSVAGTSVAPGEDLDRYPRSLEADVDVCADEGADLAWLLVLDSGGPFMRTLVANAGELHGVGLLAQVRLRLVKQIQFVVP